MGAMGRIWDRKYWQTQHLGARFVAAPDSKVARRTLDQLEPLLAPHLVRTLAAQKVSSPEVLQQAVGYLHQRLTELREHDEPLPDLERLAEAAAYESLTHHLNEQIPRRRRLQLLILYVLRNRADRFSLSRDAAGILQVGMQRARTQTTSRRWSRLQAEPSATAAPLQAGLDLHAPDYLSQLLERLLGWLGHRVPIVPLVSVIAALNEVPDPLAVPTDERLLLAEKIEAVYLLRQLWEELLALPARQRLLLLLGAQDEDGRSLLLLFCQHGIVSEATLAQSLEIGPRSFPLLLRELPCDDSRLAELVKLTPDAVRQLRQTGQLRLRTQLDLWGQS